MADSKEYFCNADEKGSVNISEDVIAQISAAAIADIEGVGVHASASWGKKTSARGVKISIEDDMVCVDASIMVKQGYPVTEVAKKAQSAVWETVESTTGLQLRRVNVLVTGVMLSKDK